MSQGFSLSTALQAPNATIAQAPNPLYNTQTSLHQSQQQQAHQTYVFMVNSTITGTALNQSSKGAGGSS
jgi:hypothetical protein